MSVHAKSLNQLAREVETQADHGRISVMAVKSVASDTATADSPTAKALREIVSEFTRTFQQGPLSNTAAEATGVPIAESGLTPPSVSAAEGSAGDFVANLEGGFGLRNRGEDRAALRRDEAKVRLYCGFASRADVTGKN